MRRRCHAGAAGAGAAGAGLHLGGQARMLPVPPIPRDFWDIRMKRSILSLLTLAAVTVMLAACADDQPRFRVQNDIPDKKVNVQLKPSAGSTITINDVAGTTTTSYQNINEGSYVATVTVQSSNDAPSLSFSISNGNEKTLVVQNTSPVTIVIQDHE
jgi:hypothetical protein